MSGRRREKRGRAKESRPRNEGADGAARGFRGERALWMRGSTKREGGQV